MTQLTFLEDVQPSGIAWAGQRNHALARLKSFVPRAGRAYASTRNYDFGPDNRDNISCLSPWIKHRLLREDEVLHATLARHSLSGAEKFIQEVFWRSYFKGWLEQRTSVWAAFSRDVIAQRDQLDGSTDLRACYDTAIAGKTGIDCFDAWARELVETGYLHNHARMWFASIWIFTLRLPWQLGADFFYQNLLDGDAAANTLSWRWVGGLHTKGKNYIARKDNIEKYTDGRFSPIGLVPNAEPLFEAMEHSPNPLPLVTSLDGLATYGLVITPEDCHAESLPLPHHPAAILGLTAPNTSTSDLVKKFADDGLVDALDRAKIHFECTTQNSDKSDIADALVQFAQSNNVTTLVTAFLPVGPMRDQIDATMPTLAAAGIRLVQVMRPYDQACWPHATKGFFKLKAKIPKLIETLTFENPD